MEGHWLTERGRMNRGSYNMGMGMRGKMNDCKRGSWVGKLFVLKLS